MRAITLSGIACLFLAACASGYAQFYQPLPTGPITAEPFSGEPSLITSTGSQTSDVDAMYTRGFGPIGYASFNGPMQGVAAALAQGKKVGAQYVVVSQQYASTVTGAIPMTTFSPQTTYTSGTVNAYGSGGYASGTYNGTSTTYNQTTTYIPYSIQRYDQAALFFAPLAREGVGLRVNEITPQDAERLGTQKGVIVSAVRRGSPAFEADILPGDILTRIGNSEVYDRPTASAALLATYGSDALVKLLRRGVLIDKIVHVPAGGVWP